MKIEKLKEKLKNELKNVNHKIKKNNENTTKKEPIIIGITGSRGKSSVCYMLHQYLKKMGYKSILYSSIEIDSDLSYVKKHCAVDNPLRSKKTLFSAVEQCINSNADFLILEVNERAIDLGIVDDVEFDLKLLTNIVGKQNEVFYPNYVNIKKSFLLKSGEKEKILLVVKDNHCNDLINELKSKNLKIITSPFLKKRYSIATSKDDYIINSIDNLFDSINGVNFCVENNNKKEDFSSSLLFPYSVFNLVCVYAVLNELSLYDRKEFNKLIKNIVIPGRDEVIKYRNRLIIISVNLVPQLEYLKKYTPNNKLIVVTGATGTGFKGWINEFDEDKVLKDKELSLKFAYNYINNNADELYITLSDTGSSDKISLLNMQKELLNDKVKCFVESDRKEAIKLAICNSLPNDVIFISGRGNREILCIDKDKISLSKDIDLLDQIFNELKGEKLK